MNEQKLYREISEEYGFEIIEIEVAVEHVHILLSFLPRHSIGEMDGVIKSNRARGLFREFPSLKGRLWAGEAWA